MNYQEIKQKELETTKDYSNSRLSRYIKSHKILLRVSSEFFFWSISFIMFMIYPLLLDNTLGMSLFFLISHLVYWKLWGTKWYHKEMNTLVKELELTIEVLQDIKKERNS